MNCSEFIFNSRLHKYFEKNSVILTLSFQKNAGLNNLNRTKKKVFVLKHLWFINNVFYFLNGLPIYNGTLILKSVKFLSFLRCFPKADYDLTGIPLSMNRVLALASLKIAWVAWNYDFDPFKLMFKPKYSNSHSVR